MPNTYTQLYIQIVFAVKGREALIPKNNKNRLEKYITGIVQNKKCKMLAISCMPDHTHLFVGLHPEIAISDLVRDIKSNSSSFINDEKITAHKFSWQSGFGAFSYAQSQIDSVVKYVLNQEEHHKKKTFKEEYLEFLKKFEIEFKDEYLFEFYE